MKQILVTSSGGAPATNFIRSLRDAPEPFYIIGVDSNKYTLMRSEADERYLIPSVNSPSYSNVLKEIIKKTKAEFLHCQMSAEMIKISSLRNELKIKTLLPHHDTIVICENKYLSYKKWQKAHIPVPQTILINTKNDLKRAFQKFGPTIWLRNISGSAGKGAYPTNDFESAFHWIELNKGWKIFTAAECLEKLTVTWQSVWHKGQLVVAQGRKRLYWEFANRTLSGVTGITGTGVTVSDKEVDKIALQAILAIDKKPNGIFGVDLTYDLKKVPNVTEINIGRFFTTHYFFTAAGLNLPYIFVKLGYGESVKLPKKRINPLKPGLAWVRGMDINPVLTTEKEINSREKILKSMLARISF